MRVSIHQHHAHGTRMAITQLPDADRHARDQHIREAVHGALAPLGDSRYHLVINHTDDGAEALIVAKNLGSNETDATAPARAAAIAHLTAAGHTVTEEAPSPQ